MKRLILLISFATVVLGVRAVSILPRATAAHFCQLLVCDNSNRVMSLTCYIRQHQAVLSDSLSAEQSFCTYVFNYDGWQSLRIFPHADNNGTVTWYAAYEMLPNDIDAEHQKYIHDVFPRLIAEVEAENWTQVDAYIDRMLKYQTTFAASTSSNGQGTMFSGQWYFSPLLLFLLFILLPVLIYFFTHFFNGRRSARPNAP
jgi:hypothetical protein